MEGCLKKEKGVGGLKEIDGREGKVDGRKGVWMEGGKDGGRGKGRVEECVKAGSRKFSCGVQHIHTKQVNTRGDRQSTIA